MAAARSFHVILRNITNLRLTRTNLTLDGGIWSNEGGFVPPDVIEPMARAEWKSESDGLGTGTEGTVVYSSTSGNLQVHWNNPFFGGNDFDVNPVPSGYDFTFTDHTGEDAHVTLTLYPFV